MSALKKARNIRESLYSGHEGIALALTDQLIRELEALEQMKHGGQKKRVQPRQSLDVPIEEALQGHGERAKNALKLNRIQTLEEAAELGAEKLSTMPRIGTKVLQQVKLAVEARGGEMRM